MRGDVAVGDDDDPAVFGLRREVRAALLQQAGFDDDVITARIKIDRNDAHKCNFPIMASTAVSCGAAWLITWMGASA